MKDLLTYLIPTNYTRCGEEDHALAATKIESFLEEAKREFGDKLRVIDLDFTPSQREHTLYFKVAVTHKAVVMQFCAKLAKLESVTVRPQEVFTLKEMRHMLTVDLDTI